MNNFRLLIYQAVKTRMLTATLSIIEAGREGQVIDHSLLRKVTEVCDCFLSQLLVISFGTVLADLCGYGHGSAHCVH